MAKYGRTIQWKKSVKGFSDALSYAGEHLSGWARGWMSEATKQAIDTIDAEWPHGSYAFSSRGRFQLFGGDHDHPWYSGHLHDSVAGIVSDRHRTVAIHYMPQAASDTFPQTYEGQLIIGHDWALREAKNMERVLHFPSGTWATLVVGVPYADKVDQTSRHTGYIRELNNQFASNVEDYFMIKAQGFRSRIFIADNKKK